MIDALPRPLRRLSRLAARVLVGLVALVLVTITGWIPPELAAMLGSRHRS